MYVCNGFIVVYSRVAQMGKNLPAMQETCLIPESGRSPREGNGNPLQYSYLENSLDRGAWWATVHGVTKSGTRLSDFHPTLWQQKLTHFKSTIPPPPQKKRLLLRSNGKEIQKFTLSFGIGYKLVEDPPGVNPEDGHWFLQSLDLVGVVGFGRQALTCLPLPLSLVLGVTRRHSLPCNRGLSSRWWLCWRGGRWMLTYQ